VRPLNSFSATASAARSTSASATLAPAAASARDAEPDTLCAAGDERRASVESFHADSAHDLAS